MNRLDAPELHEIDQIAYSKPEGLMSDTGIPLFYLKESNSEASRLEILFDCGSIDGEKGWVAALVGLLLAGTKDKTMAEINDQIDEYGGYFQAGLSSDHSYISLYGLNESMPTLVELVIEAMKNATLPEEELRTWINERKQQLSVNLEKVSFLAQRTFQEKLFLHTPYGNVIETNDYDQLKRDSLLSFYRNTFLTSIRKVNLVGNFEASSLKRILEVFKGWKTLPLEKRKYTFKATPGRYDQEKPGAVQTSIRFGKITFDKNHEDYHVMTVLNTVLGDYFGSRLMQNIREDKGYTYGIGSFLGENYSNGYFGIATDVGKEFVSDTLEQIVIEINRLRTELIPEEELSLVKNYLTGQFLKSADGTFAMMDLHSAAELQGLDYSFYEKGLSAIQQCTPERVLEVAQKHLEPSEFITVTVG